jgi:uncharacterized protein YciI
MYVVELSFGDAPGRLEARPAHRELLAQLYQDGKVVMAGPYADDQGALLIFDVEHEAELDRILADDPYYSHPAVRVVQRRAWSPILGPRPQ